MCIVYSVFLLHKYYCVAGYSYLVVFRVMKMAGEEGTLTKENFIKILRSSDLFLKAFDKNKDGIVTEVCNYINFDTFFTSLNTFFSIFHFTTCHHLCVSIFHQNLDIPILLWSCWWRLLGCRKTSALNWIAGTEYHLNRMGTLQRNTKSIRSFMRKSCTFWFKMGCQ